MYFTVTNHNITWCEDTSANYKFFHKYNSTITPSMIENNVSYRYPFADIFIYTYDKNYDIWTYRNQWRTWWAGIGFNASSKWPNGTKLTKFGNFQMRVTVDNRRYLEKAVAENWYDVGLTPWYDHYNSVQKDTIAFELTPRLYLPALPFN